MGMQQTTIALTDVTDHGAVQTVTPVQVAEMSRSEKVAIAIAAIKAQVLAGRTVSVMWSGGKDSSCTLALALMAMRELVEDGVAVPTLHCLHSDTFIAIRLSSDTTKGRLLKWSSMQRRAASR